MTTFDHDVVIAGGGPTGLMLAAELALAGTDALIVEPRPDQTLAGSRAGGLHARSLEVLDQRGVADRFVDAGTTHPAIGYAMIPLAVDDLPTRHPYVLALRQNHIERILAEWVLDELGAPIRRGRAVESFAADDDGLDVVLSDGDVIRTRYLVGCDGGRSTVRKEAGIAFDGIDASTTYLLAEAELTDPVLGPRPEGGGLGPIDPSTPGGPYGVVLRDPAVVAGPEPTLDDVRAALVRVFGTDFDVRNPTWITRFGDAARQAATYRAGRVLLAGDAAHVHGPQGGQGLNTGLQDAVALGWRLAQVVAGVSPDSLLDTYHDERHPVAARALENTKAQVVLATQDDRHPALRAAVASWLAMDEPRRATAAEIIGLDVVYDLGGDHPLVGRRMPDVDLTTAHSTTRVAELLHDATGVVLLLTGGEPVPVATGVRVIAATGPAHCDVPVVGTVDMPPVVVVRPDGHVAWVGEAADPGLPAALDRWFGPPEVYPQG